MRVIEKGYTVLFQGDSITNAFRKPDEVNNAYQLGMGYALIAAARILADRPGDGLTFHNRGVSGEGVAGLRKRWQADCLDLRPDVLSVLVGVNDVQAITDSPSLPPEAYETRFRALLEETRAALPDVRLVLGEPFLLPVAGIRPAAHEVVTAYGDAVNRLADDYDAAVVPLQDVFAAARKRAPAEHWSYDGVHPTAAGHWLIAQAWLKTAGEA